ncbi:MAG TPA: hypothetical protein VHL31_23865 [Geminicoccus sp.]|jgi:hypothetical protein|uniref:hypothetical protein n=1 Tax=Geminicoccus sp. TaxID=2024832 RepID=UPI002E2EB82D|nr:hypothetical protein [Geminicoccus sp.]HEX2529316.1 hypothetical protein [Geminicoccus sp.]
MFRLVLAGLLGLIGMTQSATAADLVPGGYVGGASETAVEGNRPGTISFGFTPRGSSTDRLRFDLSAAPLEAASQPRVLNSASAGEADDFVLGGALVWNDWTFNSTVLQLGEGQFQTEILGAGVAYGGVSARLALAETQTPVGETRSSMLLSTDLAAWSWLTLEGDLALTGSSTDLPEGDAAGRLGIRLSF